MAKLVIKNPRQEQQSFQRRLIIAFIIILCLVTALITRLVFLQIIEKERYTTLSNQNQLNSMYKMQNYF